MNRRIGIVVHRHRPEVIGFARSAVKWCEANGASASLPSGDAALIGMADLAVDADGFVTIDRSGNEFPAYEAYQTIDGVTRPRLLSPARTHGYLIDGLPGALFRLFTTRDYWS